ncbi:hypothetical protein B0H16DRAFT_1472410 [Mycena metata]|uniref:Uncharacterized protein n=1 Tax=Mycena metata TaxID=1033252 RepID=A0AAD7HMV0_9AGAR|nr:hypothetical protein B0H16DRAFT_1472410 [Mycena metata]
MSLREGADSFPMVSIFGRPPRHLCKQKLGVMRAKVEPHASGWPDRIDVARDALGADGTPLNMLPPRLEFASRYPPRTNQNIEYIAGSKPARVTEYERPSKINGDHPVNVHLSNDEDLSRKGRVRISPKHLFSIPNWNVGRGRSETSRDLAPFGINVCRSGGCELYLSGPASYRLSDLSWTDTFGGPTLVRVVMNSRNHLDWKVEAGTG